jgi:quercetin dioxygenase-like cupin family protein
MTNAQLKEKPNAPTYKQQPTIGGSVYVKPQDMEWISTQLDKVSIKVLYENKELGESTVLLKLEPGAVIPFHKHPELEQALVLEGSMYDHDGICRKGEYVWRKPNSFHDNRTDEGVVIFAVYRKQNVFVNNSGLPHQVIARH